ncbi:MAG: NTP transferase domain-containing protein [Nannocystaceae bacterium]
MSLPTPSPTVPLAADDPVPGFCAILLAAGKGTRMRSELPKVLHAFRGEPLVVHPLRAAASAGAGCVVVVVGHGRAEVEAAVRADASATALQVRFAHQAEQLGTGHAVLVALSQMADLHGPVLVLSGDVPLVQPQTLRQLVRACVVGSIGLGVFTPPDTTGYGRILRAPDGRVVGIREHRDASPAERAITECNAGLYGFDLDLLRTVLPTVRRDNAQGEIYLTDVIAEVAPRCAIATVDIPLLQAAGVNSPEELAALERAAG